MKKLPMFLVIVIMLFASCESGENIKIPEVLPTNWKILVNPLGTNDTIPVPAEPYEGAKHSVRFGDTVEIVSFRNPVATDAGWEIIINNSQQLPPNAIVEKAIIVDYAK